MAPIPFANANEKAGNCADVLPRSDRDVNDFSHVHSHTPENASHKYASTLCVRRSDCGIS